MSSLVGISAEPIDAAAVLASVDSPSFGGSVLFTGQVRDLDAGRSVLGLEYEAHPSAGDELARVLAEVAAQFPRVALSAVHRVGVLEIGELAVAVAAGAAHRDEAFRAARLLIDRVKDEVPIWKRQRFADGGDEWVGSPVP